MTLFRKKIDPMAKAAIAASQQASTAARAARAAVDEAEACLAAAKKAASEAQHQADLAAAEANRLAPEGSLQIRVPAPESVEIKLIASADPAELAGLALDELIKKIKLPRFSLPHGNKANVRCYRKGQVEVNGRRFVYSEWNDARRDFDLCISADTNGDIHISQSGCQSTFIATELIGSRWEELIRSLYIEAWTLRHGPIARAVAAKERKQESDRIRLLG